MKLVEGITLAKMNVNILLVVFVVLSGILGECQASQLRKKFYKRTCPLAEKIVRNVTWNHVSNNKRLPAKLLRMHFHDCFVRGCDGSVLLNSTANNTAEKEALPNRSLSGFDVIEDIKTNVEEKCPGVVSCADILALAARDSVSFQKRKPMWKVLTGRRDGRISRIKEALLNLPGSDFNFNQLNQNFVTKNLTVHDLVVLSGSHTIGVGHCRVFCNRLYNFTGKGDQDPSLNAPYAQFLKTKCRSLNDKTTTVEMVPASSLNFDSDYYAILKQHKGLFQSDAALLTNMGARKIVQELDDNKKFFREFAKSMRRMGAVEVLTGTVGEIRKKCGVVNAN